MRVVSRWNRRKKCHSHDNVCVCACYKAAAAADANAASTLTKVKTFRPLLHLPAYHLHARSVCAIFSIHERLWRLLPARRCASAVLAMTLCLCLSQVGLLLTFIYSLFYISMQPGGSTDRAGFRHEGFLRSILHCVI